MADEVPVCDVLCEAMEYLTKLGSNLRTRSETLKEKRIKKEKLKNAHAVQKAARKVLLICELSKKSLENVETGVKKVLCLVGASQERISDGGKSSSSSKISSPSKHTQKYHYFVYKKQRLRIAKQISIKHYTSVQVLTRSMSESKHDKYPVFYDCKLYRMRKKQQRNENIDKENSADDVEDDKEDQKISNIDKCDKTAEIQSKLSPNEKIVAEGSLKSNDDAQVLENRKFDDFDNRISDDSDIQLKSNNKERLSKKSRGKMRRPSRIIDSDSDVDISKPESEHNKIDEDHENSKDEDSKPESEHNKIDEDHENSKDEDSKPESEHNKIDDDHENTKDEDSKSGSEHNRIDEDHENSKDEDLIHSSPKSPENKDKNCMEKEKKKGNSGSSDNDEKKRPRSYASDDSINDKSSSKLKNQAGKVNKSSTKDQKEVRRASRIIDSDNSDNEISQLKTKQLDCDQDKKSDNDGNVTMHLNDKISKNTENCNDNSDGKNVEPLISDKSDELENDKNKCSSEDHKPLLKLVNINKLLKPTLVKKSETSPKKSSVISSEETGQLKKSQLLKKVKFEDETFWAVKRKEVKNFVPKKFTINVIRLPDVSVDLLIKYDLKKITRNGCTICVLENATSNTCIEDSTSHNKENSFKNKCKKKRDPSPEIIKVKKALLIDSDSDNSENENTSNYSSKQSSSEIQKYKNRLLQDSDCDNDVIAQDKSKVDEKNKIQNNVDQISPSQDDTLEVVEKETDIDSLQQSSEKKDDSEKNKASSENLSTDQVNEELKSSLLNDSSNDSVKSNSKAVSSDNEDELISTNKDSVLTENEQDKTKSSMNMDSNDSKKSDSNNAEQSKVEKNNPQKETLTKETTDKIKTSLLNDSSSDTTVMSPKDKSKQGSHSKRKHIMESMHAKRMLLTYSSSSETEDEKLNEVLKEIKSELLKKNDADEEAKSRKNRRRKKPLDVSDSDEGPRKKNKRNKRNSKNKISSDEISNEEDKCSNSSSSKMGRSGEKPGGSSSHNSDTQDDKAIDGLTNLKTLNKKSRRREPSIKEESDGSVASGSKKKMSKVPPLITGEGLLEAPITSDEASDAGSDAAVEEELPPVPMTLNGSSISHLAKDDLLDESNSSNQSEEKENEESDTEDTVKSKRRKANAISSDSEGGSSKRKDKDANAKTSDFEDSEDESSEPNKKKKRKKNVSDSDGSGGSSAEGGKKKRRRIKQIDSDGDSGSGSENEGKKHGRKNIRKVMGKNQLEEATKKAAREEKERVARIAERQKLYNNLLFDESGKPDEVVVDKVVLDFDPETKEPLIEVDRGLVSKLKPHQANGIKFMWDACFESVKRIKKDKGSGCILAHCMGLGKTLQVVSLTHTLLTHGELTGVERVLVVCPLSTVLNWVNEFRIWLKHANNEQDLDIYELSKYKQNSERTTQLSSWYRHGGVCVLGYEMFRNLSADNTKKYKKKMLKTLQESLVDPGPDLVVCDEGHLLKNEKTSLSQSMNRVRTLRRIVLTGTPLQNNLKEYYCMVQFVKPNLLGKYNEYLNRFVNPITNGQYTDSTDHDIRIMKRRSHVLHKMLDGAVQRRDYGVLAPFLPPKNEYVLFITLTDVQIKLYQQYLENTARNRSEKKSGFLFPDFQSLQRIWTHPLVLKYNSERYEIMQQKKREREEEDSEGSLVDFIDDDSTPDETSTEESSDDQSDVSDDSRKKGKKKKSAKKSKNKSSSRRGTRANPMNNDDEVLPEPEVVESRNENPTEWWIPMVTDDELDDLRNSHKLVLLFEILRQCEAIGDKLLVFSQSLYSLDLIEHFLGKVDEATQDGRIDEKLGGHVGSWSPGVDYFRLDGSTSCENRSIWCKNFNREDNPRARLFLISTRAGGLGINLVAANRVVIFDVSWNPSHDVQSIFRVYRFGQKKPCYIYRFLAIGTMEEKIYERQVTKQAISKRVIDEQQIDRHYAENDLTELYKFEPRPPAPRPVPLVPKDRLFAELLKQHEALIYKFHEHDSLLENKEEETLTEEERKAAWEDFENEKNRPPPTPYAAAWPMHNGMVPNLLAQQQQQLAYAALATMLRKDMPNLSDDQLRNMLPLIYSSNPGLMQKLNDIYKYPQASMMNPAMMNSLMNAGASMGSGGTSGLQYEPPWQRDQRDQQSMRLQQLMQHQSMGAKYYAGGLGSRDPVAMALQQQRAREIMLGEGQGGGGGAGAGGRPRGRPPLQPRIEHAPQEVVNLDSD